MIQSRHGSTPLTGVMMAALLLLSACGTNTPAANGTGSSATPSPQITLTPGSGTTNSAVTINGSGFPANAHVLLGVASSSQPTMTQSIGEIVAGETGQFTLIFMIPRTLANGKALAENQLLITGRTADGSIAVSAPFQVIDPAPLARNASPGGDTGTAVAVAPPKITVDPSSGGPGTLVSVTGANFPVDSMLRVHLGITSGAASSQPYASGVSDGYGNVSLHFTIPDSLSSGLVLRRGRLVIEVSTSDGSAKAAAGFEYYPPSPTPVPVANTPGGAITGTAGSTVLTDTQALTATPGSGTQLYQEPINVSIDFLNSLLRDPTGNSSVVYLSNRLRDEIANNWALPTGLGIQPGYSSFEVVFISRSNDGVVIKATMTYESGASIRNLTLIREKGSWRIDKVISGSH